MESISAVQLWSGRVLSTLAVLFLFVDAVGKLLKVAPVVEGTVKLGYPEHVVFPLGVLLLTGVVLYVTPRTSLLGAIYLTAFLGGAVATHVRVGSPLVTHVLFGVYVAVFLWSGLALRTPRLLAMLTDPQ
ncbi:MAG TPA: DoxX family protein [Nitrospira sp.]|nr:DoxX family protein [Nitrospira sp.]